MSGRTDLGAIGTDGGQPLEGGGDGGVHGGPAQPPLVLRHTILCMSMCAMCMHVYVFVCLCACGCGCICVCA